MSRISRSAIARLFSNSTAFIVLLWQTATRLAGRKSLPTLMSVYAPIAPLNRLFFGAPKHMN